MCKSIKGCYIFYFSFALKLNLIKSTFLIGTKKKVQNFYKSTKHLKFQFPHLFAVDKLIFHNFLN